MLRRRRRWQRLVKVTSFRVSRICYRDGMDSRSWRSFTSLSFFPKSRSSRYGGWEVPSWSFRNLRMSTDRRLRSLVPDGGRTCKRRWYATFRPTGSQPTCGRGESTAKSPSRALLILGDTTVAAARSVASRENRWSEAESTRPCSSSPTPPSTTTLCPLIETPSPEAPATNSLPLPLQTTARSLLPPTTYPTHGRWVSPPPLLSLPPWRMKSSASAQRTETKGRTTRKRTKCYWTWTTCTSWAKTTCCFWAELPHRRRRSCSTTEARLQITVSPYHGCRTAATRPQQPAASDVPPLFLLYPANSRHCSRRARKREKRRGRKTPSCPFICLQHIPRRSFFFSLSDKDFPQKAVYSS